MQKEFEDYVIEVFDDARYSLDSSANKNSCDFVYIDCDESKQYRSYKHAIIVCQLNQIYKSALVCAGTGGATGIYENSVLVDENSILICCSNSIFCLSLPDLKLNWVTKVDWACCFGVYAANDCFFTHGEIELACLNKRGEVLWSTGFKDILVSIDGDKPNFELHETHIIIRDFQHNSYKVFFDGRIEEVI